MTFFINAFVSIVRKRGFKENIAEEVINNYKKEGKDKVFLAAMKDADPSVPKWKIYSAYYSVVLFGRWSIIPREED